MSITVRRAVLIAAVIGIAVLGLVLAMRTGSVCPTAGLFGFPCPFCGLTRAALFAVDGNYAASLESNPMLVPVLCGILVGADWFSRELDRRYRGQKFGGQVHCVLLCILGAAVIAVYLFRMFG